MSEQAQAPGQQAQENVQPTGNSPQTTQAQPQAQASPSPGQQESPQAQPEQQQTDTWQTRYNGLQRVHQQTVEQLRGLQQQAEQATEHAGTLEQQLAETQQTARQAQEQLGATQSQLEEAQREAAFWNMVNTEYADLATVAGFVQRMATPDEQRQVFQELRQRLGSQVAQQADQQVRQNFEGATPGASPVPGGNAMTPSYADVMEHVMDAELQRNNPQEHERWMQIYRTHPQMNYESLGLGDFHDPFQTHYQSMQRAQGQTPAPRNQQHQPQAVEPETGTSPGMPGAWGSPIPPSPPRGS